jgi:hypothetical protein
MRNSIDVRPLTWRNNHLTLGGKTLAKLEPTAGEMYFLILHSSRAGPYSLGRARLLAETYARTKLRRHGRRRA